MNRDSFRALEQYQSTAVNADKRPTGVERMLGGVAARTPQLPKQNSVNPDVDQVDDYDKVNHERRRDLMEELVSQPIDQAVLDDSILLIGPMGAGKSSVGNDLANLTHRQCVSLDSPDVQDSYDLDKLEQDPDYRDFKDKEFYLTARVLSDLDRPSIVDFGAGHSVYEDEAMFDQMKRLISRFKNVVLLMPSADKEVSLRVLNQHLADRLAKSTKQNDNQSVARLALSRLLTARRLRRQGESAEYKQLAREMHDNEHFVDMPCNEELATQIQYTDGWTPDQIARGILASIEARSVEQM